MTLIAILDGHRLVIGNVGDSTGLIAGLRLLSQNLITVTLAEKGAESEAEQSKEDTKITSVAPPAPPAEKEEEEAAATAADGKSCSSQIPPEYVLISADHSPESPDEMYRIRKFRPCPLNSRKPELLMVYDPPSYSKVDCPDIFTIHEDGTADVNGVGKYYKVRSCLFVSLPLPLPLPLPLIVKTP